MMHSGKKKHRPGSRFFLKRDNSFGMVEATDRNEAEESLIRGCSGLRLEKHEPVLMEENSDAVVDSKRCCFRFSEGLEDETSEKVGKGVEFESEQLLTLDSFENVRTRFDRSGSENSEHWIFDFAVEPGNSIPDWTTLILEMRYFLSQTKNTTETTVLEQSSLGLRFSPLHLLL